jgi:sec-independent protein translocase protein TatA
MDIGPTELLIVLVIVVILFGSGRIAKLGGELGQGLREFRTGLSGEDEALSKALPATTNPAADSAAQTDAPAKS